MVTHRSTSEDRITIDMIDMPFPEVVNVLTEGNHDATGVCIKLTMRKGQFGGPHCVFLLDKFRIYGERICGLWDICEQNIEKLVAVLRVCEWKLAGVDKNTLNHAIDNHGDGIDIDAVVEAFNDRTAGLDPAIY